MPITAFNSFSDGLAPDQRSREHFIANVDDCKTARTGFPMRTVSGSNRGHFNVTSGGFSVVLKGLPGAALVEVGG